MKDEHIVLEATDHIHLQALINSAKANGYGCFCCMIIHPVSGLFYQAMYLVDNVNS